MKSPPPPKIKAQKWEKRGTTQTMGRTPADSETVAGCPRGMTVFTSLPLWSVHDCERAEY